MSKSLNLYGGVGVGLVALLTGAYNFADRNVAPMPAEAPRMAAEADSDFLLIASAQASNAAADARFGLGRPALPEEVAAWDLDVAPDGTGLPVGSGSVEDGEMLFSDNCAVCHGEFAEGVDNWPKLAGGEGTLADKDPLKTVGSYWPYLSTVWDYVHRSMPFGAAQTLSPDEVYAITAYILYSNYLVEDDFVLSNENFLEVEMTNTDGFIVDDREEAEKHFWTAEPCMENCKDSVEITMRAAVLDVTPEEEGAGEEAAAEPAADAGETEMAAAAPAEEPAAEEAPTAEATPAAASVDMALAEEGENVFKKCKACHQVGEGASNRTGPVLNGVIGAKLAHVEDFRYGDTIVEMGESGMVWDEANLTEFLTKPRDFIKGTKMSFAGLRKDEDIKAVIEYLKTFQ
ncbi:cytochrome c [Lutimaribacter pacificus]|uniref:Sulfur dehydrogenase subunit SoxD n=1 Tax=Lutimaribacter pacificus TaxID=391948 RepID=A0A1H0JRL2_9RHOB|nr:c-type cytochrome [Lutimaribacter pacificus]SDO46180.1 cytochrome c [Lutimaribacter pacificus]SHK07279.1 sulfur dehydrogenase subunit SoxD [Lutimaribacter pacificus]